MLPPTLAGVYAARERIAPVLRPTPLLGHPLLAEAPLTEEELAEGVRLALSATHNLAEGAGAAPLAAARKLAAGLRGKTVVCVMSGGNLDTATLGRILGVR